VSVPTLRLQLGGWPAGSLSIVLLAASVLRTTPVTKARCFSSGCVLVILSSYCSVFLYGRETLSSYGGDNLRAANSGT